ncbi:hypothetical protein GGI07_004285 [Coemansia sp. Benny D115]|nr:hypothetical protein GGI07_004285 [Coemansia sp. Benny D115]
MYRVLSLFGKLSVNPARGFGTSAVQDKIAAGAGRKTAASAGPKRASKAKPKAKAAVKPKAKASKASRPPSKKELREVKLNSRKPLVELPKRGAAPFSVFVREAFAKSGDGSLGGGGVTEVMKRLADKWRAMDAAQKARFVEVTELEKAKYQEQLREFWASTDPSLIKLENARRHRQNKAAKQKAAGGSQPKKLPKLRDPFAPKRPPTAFVLFVNEVRQSAAPGQSLADTLKKAGAQWKQMNDAQRAPYTKAGADHMDQYLRDKQRYHARFASA